MGISLAIAGIAFRALFWYQETMSVTGTVRNGVIVLPPGTELPEGAEVRVETVESNSQDSLADAIMRLAKTRPHLPRDYALNHGHYVRGEPKK